MWNQSLSAKVGLPPFPFLLPCLPFSSESQNGFVSPLPVLEGLTKTHSPYLEELLVTLFSAATEMTPHFLTSGPISVVTSLLLQCREESRIKKEAESSRLG